LLFWPEILTLGDHDVPSNAECQMSFDESPAVELGERRR
jgi:hypothetical protein